MSKVTITSSPYIVLNEPKTLTASVLNDDGTPVTSGKFVFKLAGKTLQTTGGQNYVTIVNGVASGEYLVTTESYGGTTKTLSTNHNISEAPKPTQEVIIYSSINEVPDDYYKNCADDTPIILNLVNGQINLVLTQNLEAGNYKIKGKFLGTATHTENNNTANININPNTATLNELNYATVYTGVMETTTEAKLKTSAGNQLVPVASSSDPLTVGTKVIVLRFTSEQWEDIYPSISTYDYIPIIEDIGNWNQNMGCSEMPVLLFSKAGKRVIVDATNISIPNNVTTITEYESSMVLTVQH